MRPNLILVLLAVLSILLQARGAAADPLTGGAGTLSSQNLSTNVHIGYIMRDIESENRDEVTYVSKRIGLQANYGLSHHFNLYGRIGMADAEMADINFRSTLAPQYGLGLRLAPLPREQKIQLVIDVNGDYFSPEDNPVEIDVFGYQASIYVKVPAESVWVMGGLQYSNLYMDIRDGGEAQAKDKGGAFVGIDYFTNPNIFFSAELHIFDQQSLLLGVGYRL